MENLSELEAEPRPENEDRFLNPSRYPSVRAVYQDFLSQYTALHEQYGDLSAGLPMSEDSFRKKFKECYPNIKIPKTNKFAQCDLCFLYRGKMELAAAEKKKIYRAQLHLHHEHVRQDKAKYYWHKSVANLLFSLLYISIK